MCVSHIGHMVYMVIKPAGKNWPRDNETKVQNSLMVTSCVEYAFYYKTSYTLKCSTFQTSTCLGCLFICYQHNHIIYLQLVSYFYCHIVDNYPNSF